MKPNEARMVISKCSLAPLNTFAGFIKHSLWHTLSSRVGQVFLRRFLKALGRGGALEHFISTSEFLFFRLIRFSWRHEVQATGSGGKTARRSAARKKRQLMSANGASRETRPSPSPSPSPTSVHPRLPLRLWKMHVQTLQKTLKTTCKF